MSEASRTMPAHPKTESIEISSDSDVDLVCTGSKRVKSSHPARTMPESVEINSDSDSDVVVTSSQRVKASTPAHPTIESIDISSESDADLVCTGSKRVKASHPARVMPATTKVESIDISSDVELLGNDARTMPKAKAKKRNQLRRALPRDHQKPEVTDSSDTDDTDTAPTKGYKRQPHTHYPKESTPSCYPMCLTHYQQVILTWPAAK
jgi:hypothetical protein